MKKQSPRTIRGPCSNAGYEHFCTASGGEENKVCTVLIGWSRDRFVACTFSFLEIGLTFANEWL